MLAAGPCRRCSAPLPVRLRGVTCCPACLVQETTEEDAQRAVGEERAKLARNHAAHMVRLRWANLPPDTGQTFALQPRPEVTGLAEAVAAVRSWTLGKGPAWLVLSGDEGVGKSHLAEAAARSLALSGRAVRWENAGELLDGLRVLLQKDARDGENAFQHLAQVAATELLVLDDLGRTKPTEWVVEQLHTLLNGRAIRHRRTLITTNETLESLGVRTSRYIAARVFDVGSGLVVVATVSGPSYRTGR